MPLGHRLDEDGLRAATRTFDTGPCAQMDDAYKRTAAATAVRAYLGHHQAADVEAVERGVEALERFPSLPPDGMTRRQHAEQKVRAILAAADLQDQPKV